MIMTKKILAAAAVLCTEALISAQTMTIEHEGAEIVLQPDSTWTYAKPGIVSSDENDDVFITITDNKILWLKPDYTWTFTKKQPKANRPKDYPALSIVSNATQPSLDASQKAAIEGVYKNSVDALRRSLPKTLPKDALKYLRVCLQNEVKENEIDVDYKEIKSGKTPGWRTDTKLAIPGYRVKKIMDCLEDQLTIPDAPAAK
jgi:hypothetical protein